MSSLLFAWLRPVIQILCHVLPRGWGRWLSYFTEAKAEVKYRASARIRGPKHDTRLEWPVSILIMTRYPFLPLKKPHQISVKNPRLLTIAGAIWFCRYRHCTPSQLWMHAPVAKERQLMTSQYHIFDRTDNLNPQWMQAVNGYLCELLGGLLCILINYIMINNENSTNLSADSLQAPQIHIVWGFLSGPRYGQWDHLLLISNRLRTLKAHSSLFKCCEKNCPNYMYWIQGKHHGSWVWVFLRLFASLKLIFIVPFNF